MSGVPLKERHYRFVMWITRKDKSGQWRLCAGYTAAPKGTVGDLKTKKQCKKDARKYKSRAVFGDIEIPR